MALLSEALEEKRFDVRMTERGLGKGYLAHTDIEKNVSKLPDDAENAEYLNLETVLEGINGKSGLR